MFLQHCCHKQHKQRLPPEQDSSQVEAKNSQHSKPQGRRKTMIRSGQAFAEIVAKAKARAGPEEESEDGEDSSPMASASSQDGERRLSLLLPKTYWARQSGC